MNCPTCGALVLKRVNFCGQCGTDLRQGSLERWNNPPPVSTQSGNQSAEHSADHSVPPTRLQSPSVAEDSSEYHDSSLSPQLIHLRTQQFFHLPLQDATLYLGKANDRQPPDIDLSNFPDSDVVSRVHARLMVRSGDYYLEDLESSNGTYINQTVLVPYQAQLLAADDRISLGRNDLVSFLFSV